MSYNDDNIFLTTYVKAFDFIEWFNSNSNSKSFFEILSVNDFLDDFLMCLCISFIALKLLKIFSSGLILINSQPNYFSIAFGLCISFSIFLSLWPN